MVIWISLVNELLDFDEIDARGLDPDPDPDRGPGLGIDLALLHAPAHRDVTRVALAEIEPARPRIVDR